MPIEDYLSASKKHFNDACILHERGRYDNCAYLSGYVVECGLKALLAFHDTVSPSTVGHNLPALSGKALRLAAFIAPAREHVDLPESPDFHSLLAQWNTSERYAAEGSISSEQAASRLEAAEKSFSSMSIPLILDRIES